MGVEVHVGDDPENRSYFFDGGLRFGCTGCGECCTGVPGRVLVTSDEVQALADRLGTTVEAFRARYVVEREGVPCLAEAEDGRCVFYENGCSVYAVRPAQCRTYPFWVKNLRSPEAWAMAARACPGIGQGRLHERGEILEIVRESPI